MNPTNQQSAPSDPYLDLLLQIRDSVVRIEQRLTSVENHLDLIPQQQQQQEQSLGTIAIPLAAYNREEDQEQRFRDSMAQHYQPPPGAPDVNSRGTIKKPDYGKDKSIGKKAIVAFLKIHGNIDEESVDSMYKSLLKESRTHKRALERALDQSPSVTTYRTFSPQIRRMEIEKFEGNIKYMYKLPIDKCKDHWVGDYFIHNVFKTIVRSNTNDSADSSVGSRTSDHTESNTQDQMQQPPPTSLSIFSPSPSLSTIQQLQSHIKITHKPEQPPLATSSSTFSASSPVLDD
ncbi:hypothetical protein INT45_009032 [Circinella minor]|uniref:Uncharacterized protein n=1 Tax=Circinella minor TaxID=1195481 RepID=A0A8H7S8G6_9FUNG|nr:hypothetical protein INT45_009032 [Circinella minor]